MIFEKLNSNHIEEAAELALLKYQKEKSKTNVLPDINDCNAIFDAISNIAKNGLGIAALDGAKLIGFMGGYGPLNDCFGTSKGIFCPIDGNGSIEENSGKIYTRLYQEAANLWVNQGILSHVIAVYAHDSTVIDSLFHNGLGLRCVDGMKRIKSVPAWSVEGYSFREAKEIDYPQIAKLENRMTKHLRTSPMFMPRNPNNDLTSVKKSVDEGSELYVVQHRDDIIGFIKLCENGENFATELECVKNICGAYLLSDYRANGVFSAFITYIVNLLVDRGYKYLGVDYESFNPNANTFWQKHFTPYTYSLARRVDERIYPIKKL